MHSVMTNHFQQIPSAEIQRSAFNLSRGFKTTFSAGDLVPCFVDEVLPGDTFNVRMAHFSRLATPLVPVMDNMFLCTFFFFVPNRLIWTHWQQFNGEQANPGDSTSYLIPQIAAPASVGFAVGSLADYFGIPTGVTGFSVNALHFRAYNLIYNQWFRDQNLQNSVTIDTGDGPDPATDYTVLKRNKRHDYFTSCLPWPQKGTAVTIPLGSQAVIKSQKYDGTATNAVYVEAGGSHGYLQTTTAAGLTPVDANMAASIASNSGLLWQQIADMGTDANSGYNYADLSTATAATINALRQAFQIQKLYERDARGGTRYTEIIRSHFGVVSPDARLQRPEYLGGGETQITFTPIAQTSATSGQPTPQGNLAAMATVAGSGHGFVKSFTEHGVLVGLMSVRADLNYQQGLDRMWSRQTRWDFYWPALAHIGEQSVLNQEIYTQGNANDTAVFGYQERYAEYRFKNSKITGQFRSTYSTPLDMWHLAEKYTSLPALNSTWIKDPTATTLNRVLAVNNATQFLFDSYFNVKAARPLPTYGVPGFIDRF